MKSFVVSFIKNGVGQARVIKAENADIASRYFCSIESNAEYCGCSIDQCNLEERGCPVKIVSKNFK